MTQKFGMKAAFRGPLQVGRSGSSSNGDVTLYGYTASNYLQFDVSADKLTFLRTGVGGDSARAMVIDVDPQAGAGGFRFGGLYVDVNRASGQDFNSSWDGNPDCGLKIVSKNSAANAQDRGAVRGIDVQARNSGTNLAWAYAANFNARNDSGKEIDSLIGVQIRIEDYGEIDTEAIGLDVNMSIENDTGSPAKSAIRIRNTDASGMTAVRDVLLISHTSTNGFTNLINFAGASGEGIASGSLKDSAAADILCDARITIVWNGTTYYLPAYDTVV